MELRTPCSTIVGGESCEDDAGIETITSADASVTITNPNGPVTDLSVAAGITGIDVLDNGVPAADDVQILDFAVSSPLSAAVGEPVAGTAKIVIASTAAEVGNVAPENVAPDNVPDPGVSADAAREDHVHRLPVSGPVSTGTANANGSANAVARADHVHQTLVTAAAPAAVAPDNVAAAGASGEPARGDHVHALPSAAPVGTGTANAAGSANTVSRSDHVHQTNVAIEDEGTPQGNAHTIDFVGAGVTAAVAAGKATVTIPGGGGGVSDGTEFRVIVSGGGQVSGTLRRITANGRTCVAICATLGGGTTYLVQWRSVTNTQTSTLRERTINAHTSGGSSSAVSASGPTTTSSDTFTTLHTLVLGAGTWFFCFTGDVETP